MTRRLLTVAGLTLLSLLLWAPDMLRPFGHPLGRTGFTLGRDGMIVAVDPGSPAERAGIRPGQRIDWRGTPLQSRIILVDSASQGVQPIQRFPVRVQTGHGTLMAVVTAEPEPGTDLSTALPRDIFGVLLTLIAIALVLLGPSKATWGFLIFVLFGRGAPVNELVWIGPPAFRIAATIVLEPVATAASNVGLVVFALYILVESPIARWRRTAEFAAYGAGIAIAALSTWSTVSAVLYAAPIAAANIAIVAFEIAIEIAVSVIFVVTYSASRPGVREPLRWLLIGLSVNSVILSVIDASSQAVSLVRVPYALYPALSGIDSVILIATVLYAVLPQRARKAAPATGALIE